MRYSLLLLFLFISVIVKGQNIELTLASDVWPPFTDIAGNKAIAEALVQQALNRSGVKIKSKTVEFNLVLKGLSSEVYDGSSALWYSDKRAENLLFSIPYMQNRLILVGRKGNDVSATTLDDLVGKNIAIVEAYDYGLEHDLDITFTYGKNDQENLEALLNGKADFMLVDALLVQYLMTYQGEETLKNLEIGTEPLIKRSLYFAIRKNIVGADNIIENFNKEITKMIGDGSYNKILELNWISTDIDGDGQVEMVLNGNRAGIKPPNKPYSIMVANTKPSPTNTNNRFYIEGQVYNDWNSVPSNYKTPTKMPSSNKVVNLKFRLQKN